MQQAFSSAFLSICGYAAGSDLDNVTMWYLRHLFSSNGGASSGGASDDGASPNGGGASPSDDGASPSDGGAGPNDVGASPSGGAPSRDVARAPLRASDVLPRPGW